MMKGEAALLLPWVFSPPDEAENPPMEISLPTLTQAGRYTKSFFLLPPFLFLFFSFFFFSESITFLADEEGGGFLE